MENNTNNEVKKGKNILSGMGIHLALIIAIVLILGISAYKLFSWNKGEVILLDPTEDTSEFDVEVLDEILPLTNEAAADHVYDDETRILLLGNGDLTVSEGTDSSLAGYIANATGATVYNGSFMTVSMASRHPHMIEQNYPDDIYSLPYIADAICTGDFSEMDRITEEYYEYGVMTQRAVDLLKSIDYDNLDVIVIMYDSQDYFQQRPIENPKDELEISTYMGALKYAVREIQETYPYIRIIVSSMFYSKGFNEAGDEYDPDMMNFNNGTISNYIYHGLQACSDLSVTFLDNFYGTINQNNHRQYIDYDTYKMYKYVALTDAGRQELAKRIAYAVETFPNDKK